MLYLFTRDDHQRNGEDIEVEETETDISHDITINDKDRNIIVKYTEKYVWRFKANYFNIKIRSGFLWSHLFFSCFTIL